MKTRLAYRGGNAEGRFQQDKLNSLKRALLYSYQAETVRLADGREFRCLINPDKLKPEYDNKVISIPFEDICLNEERVGTTTEGLQLVGMKAGDYFTWIGKKHHSDSTWLVYLQHLEEDAYFRAEIRRCDAVLDVNGKSYPVYVRGPVETDIPWNQKKGIVWNNLNYSLVMYITKNEETNSYFERFTKIDFDDKKWEVQAVNRHDSGGSIIEVFLKETFTNSIEDAAIPKIEVTEVDNSMDPYIKGSLKVKPYDIAQYRVENLDGLNGNWFLSNNKAIFKTSPDNTNEVEIEILTGRSGKVTLSFVSDNISLNKDIEILSL